MGVAIAASLVLGWAVQAALRLSLQRWRGRRWARRGQRGERRAKTLLERAGYRIVAEQPRRVVRLRLGPEELSYEVIPDFLCERGGRRYVADAKTGAGADPRSTATRRQLLEYASVFGTREALLVDVPGGRVIPIEFAWASAPRPPTRTWLGALVVLGALCAGALFLAKPALPLERLLELYFVGNAPK